MLLQKTKNGSVVENGRYQCEYSVVKTKLTAESISYGISVKLYTDGVFSDSCYIKDITVCKEKAEKLKRTLMSGFVTPVAAYEVIDDFLAEH